MRVFPILISCLLPLAADANEPRRVTSADDFTRLIEGRALTRLGIRLEVSPDGAIRGRAFGKPVTDTWRWENGFFYRDLAFGKRDLGPNCQTVTVRGDVIRFTADEGRGDHADLTLR